VGHASGKALRFGAEEPFTVEGGQYSVNIPPVVVRFGDVTGDGVADAAFAGYELVNTSDVGERFLAIYALSATGLARVPPTRDTAAFALLDCNADGLPEVYYDPYRAPGADVGIHFTFNNRRSAAAWSLLAEGTAKGFRVDGGLAAAHARALCADAGKGPLAERDPGTWPHAIHCMRLSGVGAGDIERELSAACSHAAPPLADYCQRNGARFLQMARTSLPISLGADGATAPGCLLPPAERD
jgi:hypothetical protein